MKIAVTGGSGFIGSRLVPALLKNDFEVKVLDIRKPKTHSDSLRYQHVNVTDLESTTNALKDIQVVYHLAGPVLQQVRKEPYRSTVLQLLGTANVLEACVTNHVQKIIFASSFYVYDGIDSRAVVNEETDLKIFGMELFGSLKLTGERLVKEYNRKHHLEYVILRIGSVYGWGDCTNAVKEFIEIGLRNEPLEVWGEGERKNQYTYVNDVVEGSVSALQQQNEVFNLIAPESISVRGVAELLKSRYGFRVTYNRDMREGQSMAYMISRKAGLLLKWKPTAFEKGLELTYREATT